MLEGRSERVGHVDGADRNVPIPARSTDYNVWRRKRWLLRLRIGALLALFAGFLLALAALLERSYPGVASTRSPLLANIPNGALLARLGFSARLDPGQSAAPVRVDQVLYDGEEVYVLYSVPDPGLTSLRTGWSAPSYYPTMADGQGRRYPAISWVSASGGTRARSMASFPEPRGSTTLFLGFRSGHATIQTVRVRLNRPLPMARVIHPGVRSTTNGITVTLSRVAGSALGSSLTYVITRPRSPVPLYFYRDALHDLHGRAVPLLQPPDQMNCVRAGAGVRCTVKRVLPPLPSGTRLVLTITSMQLLNSGGPLNQTVTGPWRLPFAIP